MPHSFFCRPAEIVAPELIGCKLVKQITEGKFLWGVIVETEAYSQTEAACHGHTRRSRSNEKLFGEAGHFHVYISYGIHFCVNVVTDKINTASGVLLRAIALPDEKERIAAGPALLAKRFGFDLSHDGSRLTVENGFWITPRPSLTEQLEIMQTTRIGISKAKHLPWRWYLKASRSVSKRVKGDRCPPLAASWVPICLNKQ